MSEQESPLCGFKSCLSHVKHFFSSLFRENIKKIILICPVSLDNLQTFGFLYSVLMVEHLNLRPDTQNEFYLQASHLRFWDKVTQHTGSPFALVCLNALFSKKHHLNYSFPLTSGINQPHSLLFQMRRDSFFLTKDNIALILKS